MAATSKVPLTGEGLDLMVRLHIVYVGVGWATGGGSPQGRSPHLLDFLGNLQTTKSRCIRPISSSTSIQTAHISLGLQENTTL
jgi:hypothetical protein